MNKIDVGVACVRGGLTVYFSIATMCFGVNCNEDKIFFGGKHKDNDIVVSEESVLDDFTDGRETVVSDVELDSPATDLDGSANNSADIQGAADPQKHVSMSPEGAVSCNSLEKEPVKVFTYDDQKEILTNSGYIYEGFLGKGGFGEVYKCRKEDGSSVAVKLCCRTEHPSFGEQVSREIRGFRCLQSKGIRSSKHLNVPNCMKVYPDGAENTAGQCAMFELNIADGGDTYNYFCGLRRSIIKSIKSNLTVGETFSVDANSVDYNGLKRLAKHVLKGLKILHENGLAHGDVALRNVLINGKEDGKCVYLLGDFGLAAQSADPADPTRNFARDIERVGSMLFFAWRLCLCYDEEFRVSVDLDRINSGDFDEEYPVCTWNCCEKEGEPTLVDIEESQHKREKTEGEAAEFLGFIKKLVSKNPKDRPTVDQALDDPYLKG